MLRISRVETDGTGTRLRLEGRLVGPWVDELERACAAVAPEEPRLELDLSEVGFLDADAIALIQRLMDRGVIISGCSRFVCAQLRG
jgi:hypothetical protein